MRSGKKASIAWQTLPIVKEIGYAVYSLCLKMRRQYLFNAKNNKKLPSYLRTEARKEYESICDQHDGFMPFDPRISQSPQAVAKKYNLHQSFVRRITLNFARTGDFLFPGDKGYTPSPYEESLSNGGKKQRTHKTPAKKAEKSLVASCSSVDNADQRVNPSRGSKYGDITDDFGESLLPEPSDDEAPLYKRYLTDDSDYPSESYKAPYVSKTAKRRTGNSLCFLTPAGVTVRLSISKYLCGSLTWEQMVTRNRQAMVDAGISQRIKLEAVTNYELDEYRRHYEATIARTQVLQVYRDLNQFDRFRLKQSVRELMDRDYRDSGLIGRLDKIRGLFEDKEEQALLDEYLPAIR